MSTDEKDKIIEAQRLVIGILFEIIKRYQANNELDQEYLELLNAGKSKNVKDRIDQIEKERDANADTIGRLLKQLEA